MDAQVFGMLLAITIGKHGYPYVWGGSSPSRTAPDMYEAVRAEFACGGVKEYSYTKDGKEVQGFRYQLKLEFPQGKQTSRKK